MVVEFQQLADSIPVPVLVSAVDKYVALGVALCSFPPHGLSNRRCAACLAKHQHTMATRKLARCITSLLTPLASNLRTALCNWYV